MAGLGWQELVIVLVIVLIIFGAGRLPEVAKSLGQGVKEFRKEAGAEELPEGTTATTGTVPPVNTTTSSKTAETVPAQQMRADEI